MKSHEYEEVEINEESSVHIRRQKLSWTLFFRQMFVVTGVWVIYFSLGLSFGAPTVLISQIRKKANSSNAVSPAMESWLSSVHGYSALPFVVIIPISAQLFGRKIPFILVCFNAILANIVFYWGTTTTHVLFSEMMQGVLLGSNMTLLLPTCSEYSSPHYRAMFMTIKASCFFWGVWVANVVGTFAHWKNIGLIGLVCCAYSLSAIFWPESPSWLAMKGRYEEAAAAHHWMKGYDRASETELINLIKSQKVYQETRKNFRPKVFSQTMKLILDTIITKGYYYPLLLSAAIISLYHFSGKLVCVMYAIQLIHEITNNEETAYMGMILLEGITILGMSSGCFLSKYFKRKTLLLSSSSIASVSLYVLSLYLYLIHLNVFAENQIITLSLLVIFSVAISCGPLIIASPIFGEIISLEYKCSTLLILTFYSEILMGTVLKLAPSIFRIFRLHGAFLFFAILTSIFISVVFVYLPETKGKSLQEIEDFFRNPQKSDATINPNIRKNHRRLKKNRAKELCLFY